MKFDGIRQHLRGNEFESLKALGVIVPPKANQGGVCPNCGGHDRFSWIIHDGKWLYNCRHCGGGDCFNLITKLYGNNPKRAAEALTGTATHQFQAEQIYNYNQLAHSSRNIQAEKQAKAACLAQSIWESSFTRTDHYYLESRGIHNLEVNVLSEAVTTGGVLFEAGSIIVPLFDGNKLANVQLINDCGDKRYLKDGKKSGCSHVFLAENPTEIYVCEGYATAITVWLALNPKQHVVVAFDAGNIPNVVDSLREHNLPLVFMADNDKVGIDKAKQAAIDGEPVLIPPFKPEEQGTDWDDYRQLGYDVSQAIVEARLPASKTSGEKDMGFLNFPDVNSNAKPIGTSANLAALVDYLGYTPAQNAMNLELEMLKDGVPIDSSFESKRSFLISECLKSGLSKSVIDDHLMALCERNKYHPVKAYFDNGCWDGVKRIDSLIEAMKPKDMRIAKAVMTKWLVACVAAIYETHFSCKIVPILQGGQSFKKTAFISRFANVVPGSFLEGAELNPDNKDSVLSCIKAWIVELGELERTSKNSQGSLKAFITKANDSVRPPYGRSDIKKKRQSTLIATVNGTEFLRDETGSSRYAVIELEKAIDMDIVNDLLGWRYQDGRTTHCDPNKLRQFWLEAKFMYDNGASWELSESELDAIAKVNKQHNFKGNWYEFLEERFVDVDMKHRHFEWMKASEICSYCEIPNNNVRMVGKALKMLAENGLLQVKKGRSRNTYYRVPIISEGVK